MDWSGGETQDRTTKRIARDHFQDSKTWRPRAPFANYFDIRYAWWYRVQWWCSQQTLFSPISYPPSTHRPMCLSINNTNLNYERRVVWREYLQVVLSFVLRNCMFWLSFRPGCWSGKEQHKRKGSFPWRVYKLKNIQGVTGGTDQTSGECSLCWTIPI